MLCSMNSRAPLSANLEKERAMPRPKIFISYARGSSASITELMTLEPALEQAGFEPFRDVNIILGDEWEAS
jgi:hypothetical protein